MFPFCNISIRSMIVGFMFISVCCMSADAQTLRSDSSANATRVSSVPRVDSLVIPDGPMGDVIRLGRDLVADTVNHPLSKPYVGNSLNCTSCHLDNGTHPKAATFIAVATAYPAYSPREKRVITLEDRVLNCFMRSCNGVRPPLGSRPSVAITAYITWLSSGQAIAMNASKPLGPHAVKGLEIEVAKRNENNGKTLYSDRCASCHGDDGQGDGDSPPVWGDMSYNDGAGLAGDIKLASWLKVSMPLDEADLTDQEAL
ncbi:MAG TPA: cytochrome C, partial [Planctomycetaceae bacterium]|nr:cytochrome C [Planctomycetaceae bacterium]